MDPERFLQVLRRQPKAPMSLPRLMEEAGVPPRKEKEAKRTLKSLVRKGVLERERGRRYRLSRAGQDVEGRVLVDRKGRAFLSPNQESGQRSQLPLVYDDSLRPQHQDRVRAERVQLGRQRRTVARLIEILDRPTMRHVGVLERQMGADFVQLDARPQPQAGMKVRPSTEVLILPGQRNGAEIGDLVEVEFEPAPDGHSMPVGQIKEILGRPGDRETEMRKLLIEHELDRPFPPAVVKEAEAFGTSPRPEDITGRKDARHLGLVTIDGETAKDFDDAVWAVREGKNYRLCVAIADVSHYVRLGTALDDEAYRRSTSTYLTDRAIPMLPEALSNGLCSLVPHEDRLCMMAELLVDETGRVRDARFHRAVMRSKARLTYTRVAKALDGEPDDECRELLPTLLVLAQVSRKLQERRLRRGAVDLDLPEPAIVFDEEGHPIEAVRRPRNDAHRIIEDLMIAANEAVARHLLAHEMPALFRIHEDPDPERLSTFVQLCESLGLQVRIGDPATPADISRLLLQLSEHRNGKALHQLLLRSLAQARYAAENKGHFGLASTAYLHCTSPIRRYPDLVVHRVLKQLVDDEPSWYSEERLDEMATHCSDAERKAMLAERASLDLDRTLIAEKLVGEHLPGVITGVQNFGLFVQTVEPFIEGMVPIQTLPSDYYEPDPYGASLRGVNSGAMYTLGDSIEVQVAKANVARRQVEMHLVEASSPPRRRPEPRATASRGRRPPQRDEPRRGRQPKPRHRKTKKRR